MMRNSLRFVFVVVFITASAGCSGNAPVQAPQQPAVQVPEQPPAQIAKQQPAVQPAQEVNLEGKVAVEIAKQPPAVQPIQEVSLEGKVAGELWDGNELKMKFRWCPAGTFMMGSPESEPDRSSTEGPVTVKLTRGFWMSQHEVTQGEWQSLMVTTITDQKTKAGSGLKLYGEGARYPMYYVSHNEATEFCRELTDSERSEGRLPAGWEYRLPTEAQWEYACRAGTTTATAFGNSLSSTQANFASNFPNNGAAEGPNVRTTKVVGSFKANAWGLYDMHGNVEEFCRDWHADTLPGGRDPEVSQPGEDSFRVYRGGCWLSDGRVCRSAYRNGDTPGDRNFNVGFRLATVRSR